MAAAKKPTTNINYLEQQADTVRKSLAGNHQSELFQLAIESGYLAALADGQEDAGEREALVKAVETLSSGMIIEWEVETVLADAYARITAEGNDARAVAIGTKLKQLGGAEAVLLVAAIVSHATSGVDKKEAQVLEKIGTAAGVPKPQIANIVKKARG